MYVLTASSKRSTHQNPHSLLERCERGFHHAVTSVCNEMFGFCASRIWFSSDLTFTAKWSTNLGCFCVTRGTVASLPLATTPFAGLPPLHFRWTKLQVTCCIFWGFFFYYNIPHIVTKKRCDVKGKETDTLAGYFGLTDKLERLL